MNTGRINLAVCSTILSALLSACASSSAPAPVEQRRPAYGRAYPPSSVLTPQSQAQVPDSEQQDAEVQVTGLEDDFRRRASPPGDASNSYTGAPAESTMATDSTSPARAAQLDSSADGFAVANPAVVALLNRANRDAAAGRQGASAASLERAIKIEPGNAWLWHRLAQTRVKQNRPGEAASIAARSNSLAGNDNALRARNWRLIASVHRLRGESVAAQAAQRKAESLERGAS